ncbi:unnamed protein product [Linum tenue]|uniref:Acyl-coenzyme A thioesterase 13 n=1 Tax=Linum tenue TaxID=586396 RepID=A0AAV0L4U1_9ROSI|nr:unnamed protein product [Linum tenue]
MGDGDEKKTEKTMDTVAVSNEWLEGLTRAPHGQLEGLTMDGLKIVESSKGFIRCHFTVPDRITDGDGNWHVGAMATMIDDVGAAAIFSLVGHVKASLDFTISFLSTAKSEEKMELEAKVVGEKERLASVVIEVRRRSNGELIALGKQWMAAHNKL